MNKEAYWSKRRLLMLLVLVLAMFFSFKLYIHGKALSKQRNEEFDAIRKKNSSIHFNHSNPKLNIEP